MVLSAIVYFLILALIDYYRVQKLYDIVKYNIRNIKSLFNKSSRGKNSDSQDLFRVENLQKTYDGKKKVVDIKKFTVSLGECFGLLGVNGAGKSTTFRILTGEEPANDGIALINKIDLEQRHFEYQKCIGYCPQYDSINEVLTGRETLQLFAKLRGIPKDEVNEKVEALLEELGLEEFANVPAGKYSGGNKRKLNFGISIIGSPLITFLDEPTSGVDPVSRRKLWNVIKNIKDNKNASVILSSHSMEECEALCNK